MFDSTLPPFANEGPQSRIVRVTPEMAAAWLARNVTNRTISEPTVRQYAADMRNGMWTFTGQPIIFDSEGRLSDGQHRLTAQVNAEIVLDWLVITGVEPIAQDFLDIGRPRSVANQLQIKGVGSSHLIASVARLDLIHDGEPAPSKPQIREHAERNLLDFAESAQVGKSISQVIGGSASAYAVAHCHASRVDADAAETFFTALRTGAELSLTSPILVARQFVSRLSHSPGGRAWNDGRRSDFVNYLFKAWNLWRAGKSVKSFKAPTTRQEPK